MHHSVDRMLRLAGRTEETLGFRYGPASARSADRLETSTTPEVETVVAGVAAGDLTDTPGAPPA